jgi:hypothetical protein
MARKVVSRKAKRAESDAAAKKPSGKGTKAKTKAKPKAATAAPKKKKAKAPTKRKSRAKSTKVVRLKAFWGVFNQTLKRVALFEYNERKKAEKMAAELTANGKSPHFIQLVKDAVPE